MKGAVEKDMMQTEGIRAGKVTISESVASRNYRRILMRSELIAVLGIIVLTIAVYYPVIGFEFIDLDDDGYVFQNEQVQQSTLR